MTISFERSTIMLEQAQAIFPGGVQGSRLPFYPGESPAYMQRGLGPRCWDVDGHEYIDYTLGVGPIILGYAHPAVNAAVAAVLPDGMCFTFNHPLQNELARTLIRLVPGADWACFFKLVPMPALRRCASRVLTPVGRRWRTVAIMAGTTGPSSGWTGYRP